MVSLYETIEFPLVRVLSDMEKTGVYVDTKIIDDMKEDIEAYKKTESILNANMPKLHELAAYLMKHEKMSGETFDEIMDGTYVEPIEEPQKEETTEE